MEMLCIMHQGEPYGHLVINGNPIGSALLSRMVGASKKEVDGWLEELESAAVFSRNDELVIFSRRMARDEEIRIARATGGILGAEHGSKGGPHGAKGGRPRKEGGNKNPPPSDARGVSEPPSEPGSEPPPSVFSLQSSTSKPEQRAAVVTPTTSPTRAARLAVLLREKNVRCTSMHPEIVRWANELKVTDEEALGALEIARLRKPEPEGIPVAYLTPILLEIRKPPKAVNGSAGAWWASEQATLAKAKELGMTPRGGESWDQFRGRIRERIAQQETAA
jgi:hypothetical protein